MKVKNWLNQQATKHPNWGIPNLMRYVVMGMTAAYILNMFSGGLFRTSLVQQLAFHRDLFFQGQLWRMFTFLIIPPASSPLFVIFHLYFYWLIGENLENYWGTFAFNVFYLCGAVGALVGGLITGYATNYFLNWSLFLAFAALNPDFTVLLFFFFPLKMKYLALLSAVLFFINLPTLSFARVVAIVISLINLWIFFGEDIGSFLDEQWRNVKDFFNNRGS